jgi:alkyldihydroxyacetonephosphate synthase
MCHVSHLYASGASLYFTFLARAEPGAELAQWRAAKRAASEAIVAAGGTITHHHAVGRDHREWLAREAGELGLDALRAAKERLDPAGVMNPGKLLPDER